MGGMNSYLVRAGNLRKRLTFQTKDAAQDALGEPVNTWTTIFTCWGEIIPLTGRELIAAASIQSEVSHTVMVRYRTELATPKSVAAMRILYKTRIFNIMAPMNEDERDRVVSLMVSEGMNNG